MSELTVIIPTFNGGKRLLHCIKNLKRQEATDFTVLLVNNKSTDDTISRVVELQQKGSLGYPLKIIAEPEPGAQNARMRGAREATSPFLLFCDDDNLLEQNYLSTAVRLLRSKPDAGMIGGFGKAVSEDLDPLPPWFEVVGIFYAAGGHPPLDQVELERTSGTYTAGMAARREVFIRLEAAKFAPILSGRVGKSLVAGEDIELCKAARLAGFNIYRDARLRFEHIMPRNRLEEVYAKRLCAAMGSARVGHRAYDYFLEPELQQFRESAWYHEMRIALRPTLRAAFSLLASRPVEKVEERVRISGFLRLLCYRATLRRNLQYVATFHDKLRELGFEKKVDAAPVAHT